MNFSTDVLHVYTPYQLSTRRYIYIVILLIIIAKGNTDFLKFTGMIMMRRIYIGSLATSIILRLVNRKGPRATGVFMLLPVAVTMIGV